MEKLQLVFILTFFRAEILGIPESIYCALFSFNLYFFKSNTILKAGGSPRNLKDRVRAFQSLNQMMQQWRKSLKRSQRLNVQGTP